MFEVQRWTSEFRTALDSYISRGVDNELLSAMHDLRTNPFKNSSLQTHEVKNTKAPKSVPVLTSKVPGGRRIIWTHSGSTQVLLLVGEHQPVYRRAERLRVQEVVDGELKISYEPEPQQLSHEPPKPPADGALFDFLKNSELAAAGIDDLVVPTLRVVRTTDQLTRLTGLLQWDQLMIVWDLLEKHNATLGLQRPTSHLAIPIPQEAVLPERPGIPVDSLSGTVESYSVRIDHLASVPNVSEAELREWLARPIEEWMIFLDPAQKEIVRRPFSGPARISGPAGTGKTVVGLHRAKAQLQSVAASRVLITTLVATLPKVMDQIYQRFDTSAGDRAEFVGLHAWAHRFLTASGRKVMFNPQQAGSFLESAARSASQQYASSGITQAYARDEVSWVIKGRGLTTLAEYLKVSRDGRGSPLRPDQRATMWAIAADYERRLGKAGLLDENDLLIEATKLVQSEGLAAPYSLVVVDEAQDLTLVGARLVAAIAERSGGQLLILGDGHQSIYPGSFRLIDAGIDVRGRARVLTRNYRNGFEILRAAEAVADSEGAEDPLDRGDAELPGTPTRLDPGLVALTQFNSGDDLRIGVAIEIERLTKNGVRTGDIAILVPTNQQVDNWATQMRDFNQPTMKLASYEGRTTHHIKIGTYHRAKGLEFKHVLMPAVDAVNTQDARRTGEDDRDYAERQGLMRRRMFVAMTRARDSLWMGWTGPASTSIAKLIKLG